jgi:hypothetical protein
MRVALITILTPTKPADVKHTAAHDTSNRASALVHKGLNGHLLAPTGNIGEFSKTFKRIVNGTSKMSLSSIVTYS